jgi:hypothetical protein
VARICASRKRTHSIMSNAGFGDLVMYSGGKKLVVPQRYITKEGLVYKRVNKHIVEENFEKLEELGVAVI